MELTTRFIDAVSLARDCHEGQQRKGSAIPYLSHPLGVASLVLEYGGSEDEAIAGLLHDVLEDDGDHAAPQIESRFGGHVLQMVIECSDAIIQKGEEKPPWAERKLNYVAQIPHKSEGAQLVTACDKLHNLTAIVRDWQQVGDQLWTRFNAREEGSRWYYENVAYALLEVEAAPAHDLAKKLGELGWEARAWAMPERLAH